MCVLAFDLTIYTRAALRCTPFINDVAYPLYRLVRFLISAALVQHWCSPSRTGKRCGAAVVQAGCLVADDKLLYVVSFPMAV